MEDSSATTATRTWSRRGEVPEEISELETEAESNITPFSIPFKPFLVTPTLQDASKELAGIKMEAVLNVFVLYPTATKYNILDQGTTMLYIYFRWSQKIEAQSKQLATNEGQISYIPGSLRTGNPDMIPNYLKGSNILQETEERKYRTYSEEGSFRWNCTRYDTSRVRRNESNVEDQVHQDNRNYFRTPNFLF